MTTDKNKVISGEKLLSSFAKNCIHVTHCKESMLKSGDCCVIAAWLIGASWWRLSSATDGENLFLIDKACVIKLYLKKHTKHYHIQSIIKDAGFNSLTCQSQYFSIWTSPIRTFPGILLRAWWLCFICESCDIIWWDCDLSLEIFPQRSPLLCI